MPQRITKKQINKSLDLAKKLIHSADNTSESPFSKRMGPLIQSPESKHFVIRLMDVAFRSKNNSRVSNYVLKLINKSKGYDVLFSNFEIFLIIAYRSVGRLFPAISVPAMLTQIRSVTGPILFFVGDRKFRDHSRKRKKEGVILNVNLIGEALLGEEEAARRIKNYCHLLNQKEVDYISIKLSSIYSQINPLAHDHTVDQCVHKLSEIYDEVLNIYKKTGTIKFVTLDMEEYRDLGITIDAFKKTLSISRFQNLRMGIVLQAYLPDSYNAMKDLVDWATNRINNGGAPIKVRIVKGANLEMEKTEASLEEWPVAPYERKVYSDANFKKILLELLDKNSLDAVNLGVASHNIFDLAFALNIVKEKNLYQYVDFEMLEGMANQTVTQLLRENASVLLYTPIVKEEDYNSAMAYLVRRLDEGTQEGNFLKEGFDLEVDSAKWKELEKIHLESIHLIDKLAHKPKRDQNRTMQKPKPQSQFKNVPNTDWILPANRAWIEKIRTKWNSPADVVGNVIPVVAEVKKKNRKTVELISWSGTLPWRYEYADEADYRQVVEAGSEWQEFSHRERATKLRAAAVEFEKDRGDLIAVAMTELGKTISEVDIEVSEAIDFANYYAQSIIDLTEKENLIIEPKGINLVISPWNFPIAIPMGGIFASLAAGKRVILKPSRNATACSYLACQCLWRAGVPKSALSFLPTLGSTLDPLLSKGYVFDAVILTGGTNTAQFLLDRNPRLKLFAETGGKNSTIVTSLADRDQAINNVVQSAFGNTGQKCSATSLLVLEKEVYEDEHFKILLKDATKSKIHGDPRKMETEIGPLAVEISDKLKTSVENTLSDDWLLAPKLNGNFMLSPSIKWGVTEKDFEYKNELFGPVLAVMKADDLKDGIRIVNGVEYGLTSGIESLDHEEIDYWKDHIMAGNLFANRTTTGAIVERQPFGGMKASCFGFGMKAGGLNYVLQFSRIKEGQKKPIYEIKEDYQTVFDNHFSQEIDYAKIRGQHNINRYLKPQKIVVLISHDTTSEDIRMVQAASEVIGVEAKYYSKDEHTMPISVPLYKLDSWNELEKELNHDTVVRALNYSRLDDDFLKLCHSKAVHVYGRKPSPFGRVELLTYLNEQNVSINYHRYGNLLGEGAL